MPQQQIVDLAHRTGSGIFNRHDAAVDFARTDKTKDLLKVDSALKSRLRQKFAGRLVGPGAERAVVGAAVFGLSLCERRHAGGEPSRVDKRAVLPLAREENERGEKGVAGALKLLWEPGTQTLVDGSLAFAV